jgi:hypothetical protein
VFAGFLSGFAQLAKQQCLSLVGIVRQFEPKFVRRRPSVAFDDFDDKVVLLVGLATGVWGLVIRLTPSAAFGGTSP